MIASAMGAYRAFRKEPGEIGNDECMMILAGMFTELDKKRRQVETMDQISTSETAGHGKRTQAGQQGESHQGDNRQQATKNIAAFEAQIAHLLVHGARFSPAGVRTEEELKERLGFFSRLTMALFGGAILVVPMLIMSLRPSKLTGLLTTSLFVVGVAVALAGFMRDAGPKDILAATAAYAAVLVVFVGTDGA
jgi:VIT1/CCC1 family predicted Fe2+/Mn2+ transporter